MIRKLVPDRPSFRWPLLPLPDLEPVPDAGAVLERMDLPDGIAPSSVILRRWAEGEQPREIAYGFWETPWGQALIASTERGVCYAGLTGEKPENVLADLAARFGGTGLTESPTPAQQQASLFLAGDFDRPVVLHLKGTGYQLEIWQRLLRVPFGQVVSYSALGGGSRYARAAGAAVGRNPVFYLVPCHRAVKHDGTFDGYFWGSGLKGRLLGWEFMNSPAGTFPAPGTLTR